MREKLIDIVEYYADFLDWERKEEMVDSIMEFLATDNNVGSRWIPVTERFPEDGEQVLACTKNGKAFSAHYDHFWGKWSVSHTVKITHWMPLPEAPKEVE